MSVDIMVAVQGAKMSLDWLVEIYCFLSAEFRNMPYCRLANYLKNDAAVYCTTNQMSLYCFLSALKRGFLIYF